LTFRIDAVASSRSPEFASAYAVLAEEFASRGELERREVIEQWLDVPPHRSASSSRAGDELQRSYHLLVATDPHGELAGVRDCHVVLDPRNALAVVYLAHVLVLPAFRRSGLGGLFRSVPVVLARRALNDAGIDARSVAVLLAAEMEPAMFEDDASIVRLTAYGKDGFAAIHPAALPYCQPDFRDLGATGLDEARPLPLLAVVRLLGHDGARTLRKPLARAFVRHLYAVFATHVRAEHLAALEARTFGALDAFPEPEAPLLPLPRTIDDRAAIEPLTRAAVLPFFPAAHGSR
jgi:hypothetical protein